MLAMCTADRLNAAIDIFRGVQINYLLHLFDLASWLDFAVKRDWISDAFVPTIAAAVGALIAMVIS
jgi:hypothetical protein